MRMLPCTEPVRPFQQWTHNLTLAQPVYAGVCVRAQYGQTLQSLQDRTGPGMAGYCLNLFYTGQWQLQASETTILAQGAVPGGFQRRWYRLQVTAEAGVVVGMIDSEEVARVADNVTALAQGMAALRSGYHFAFFNNLMLI